MKLEKAKRIEELRTGEIIHSWRLISEIICEEFGDEPMDLSGNQLHGSELCLDAMITLHGEWQYISEEIKYKWY